VLKARRRSNDATDQDASALNFRRTTSNATFYFYRTQLDRPRRGKLFRASPETFDVKGSKRDGEKGVLRPAKNFFPSYAKNPTSSTEGEPK
jgi:hypothetical protein